MYKKKKNNKIIIPIIIVVLIILLSASLLIERNTQTIFKDLSISIEKVIMYPFTSLNKEKGDTQSESYLIQKNINSSLEKEIQELKDTLELNKTLTEYTPVNATILSRNKSYWFNTITIDKGSNSGIEKNMAVITKNGLIGKISKVSKTSSEVKLITSDDINFKVSVAIKTNGFAFIAMFNACIAVFPACNAVTNPFIAVMTVIIIDATFHATNPAAMPVIIETIRLPLSTKKLRTPDTLAENAPQSTEFCQS